MNKCQPIPFKLLHNKTFTTKKSSTDFTLKFNANRNPFCRSEKGILLTNNFPIIVHLNPLE